MRATTVCRLALLPLILTACALDAPTIPTVRTADPGAGGPKRFIMDPYFQIGAYWTPGNEVAAIYHTNPQLGPNHVDLEDSRGIRYVQFQAGAYWTNDHIHVMTLTNIYYGSHVPGCEFTNVTTTANLPYSNEACPPTWVQIQYTIELVDVQQPVNVWLWGGASRVVFGESATWNVAASGGGLAGIQFLNFKQVRFVDNVWTTMCDNGSTSCTYAFPSVAGEYYVHANVSAYMFVGVDQGFMDLPFAATMQVTVAPPVSAGVNGPSSVEPWVSDTWTVSASGGFPPYSYSWTVNGQYAGSDASVSGGFPPNSTVDIGVVVTDDAGHTASASTQVSVGGGGGCSPWCELKQAPVPKKKGKS